MFSGIILLCISILYYNHGLDIEHSVSIGGKTVNTSHKIIHKIKWTKSKIASPDLLKIFNLLFK